MWFHLFTGNHCPLGHKTLFDMMEWVTAGLTDLGHEVTAGDTIAPNAMNVFWENFHDTDERFFTEQRFKFGLIATELPTGRTFNWLEYDPWLTRRRCFEKIAPRAQFIWSMVKEPVDQYKQWAPAAFLELGFSEKLVDPVFDEEPRFDFSFYGLSITPYRQEVLARLKTRCAIAMPDRILIGRELNRFIASAKVGICLKHLPDWPIASPVRLSRYLHSKRGIAAEYAPLPTGPSAFVPMARKDQDFAEFCLEVLNGPWKQRAEEAYERFRAEMPMKRIMERLLDETALPSRPNVHTSARADDGARDWVRFQAAEPRLVDSHRGYNFVQYKDFVYAIKQSVGPLDVAIEASTLLERFGPDCVVVAQTLEEARTKVDMQN